MGRLSELWSLLKEMEADDPRRDDIQKQINDVEAWMIQKGYKKDGITKWGGYGNSKNYPDRTGYIWYEDIE